MRNRTLLEMHIGMIAYGILCQAAGVLCYLLKAPFLRDLRTYALSLWSGVLLAGCAAVHMYKTLDRSLDRGEGAAKLIFGGYMVRYLLLILIMVVIVRTGVLNPLAVFLGYMGLKASALMQPFTHRLSNLFFHETDPEPEPLPQEEEQASEDALEPGQEPERKAGQETGQETGQEPEREEV